MTLRSQRSTVCVLAVCFLLAGTLTAGSTPGSDLSTRVLQSPLRFEPNQGQATAGLPFVARGPGYTLLLGSTGALLNLGRGTVSMMLAGANASAPFQALDRLPGVSNYLVGNNPSKWRTGVPTYSRVQFDAVYPGISVLYYGNQRRLEYDFVVAPGADPSAIHLTFDGATRLNVDAAGDLWIDSPAGRIRQHKPVVYQKSGTRREAVEGRYELLDERNVAFRIGAYDRNRSLVIDPVLAYSTFLGGSGDEGVFDVAVDAAGSAYVTGVTGSSGFPTTAGSFDRTFAPTVLPLPSAFGDAFVSKFSPDGSTLIYSTFLGGNDADGANAIAVDSTGNVAIVGATASPDFPTTSNGYKRSITGPSLLTTDQFVTVLNKDGNALVYSTYFGSSVTTGLDLTFEGAHVTFDAQGMLYFGTQAMFNDLPARSAAQASFGGGDEDAYVAKFNPKAATGNESLVYATYLGGSKNETVTALAVDAAGNAYVRGGTCSNNFPTAGTPYQSTRRGDCDAFLTKLSPTGNQFLYSTYLGGGGYEYGFYANGSSGPIGAALPGVNIPTIYSSDFGGTAYGSGLALDAAGFVYVSGSTTSTDFPTTAGAYQTAFKGNLEAFLVKFDLTKTGAASVVYSTLLGGAGIDRARAVVVDPNGITYVHGETNSTDFPVTSDALQTTRAGGWDLFLSVFDPDGASLLYSTYLGGNNDEQGLYGLARDSKGGIYIGAASRSGNYPTSAQPYDATFGGGWDGVVTKINIGPVTLPRWVQNSASYVSGKVAPGEIAVVYGEFFGPDQLTTMVIQNNMVQTTAGGTRIYFDGVAAPVVYAANFGTYSAVSCVVPWEVSGKATTRVQVEYQGVKGNTISVPVVAAVPAFYTMNQSGAGQGAVLNQDYSLNSATNAVERGGWVFMYGTGGGLTNPVGVTGSFSDYPPLYSVTGAVSVTVGGKAVPASDVAAFSAPSLISGAMQVNVKIPADVAPGPAEVILTVAGQQSRAGVTVYVK